MVSLCVFFWFPRKVDINNSQTLVVSFSFQSFLQRGQGLSPSRKEEGNLERVLYKEGFQSEPQ